MIAYIGYPDKNKVVKVLQNLKYFNKNYSKKKTTRGVFTIMSTEYQEEETFCYWMKIVIKCKKNKNLIFKGDDLEWFFYLLSSNKNKPNKEKMINEKDFIFWESVYKLKRLKNERIRN